MVTGLSTFILVFCNLAVGTSTGSVALFLDPTSPTSPYPTSDRPALAVRLRGNIDSHSDDHGEGQPPSEQPHSPKQVCPTDPPIPCSRPNCLGSPNPPDAYRCKSRSTTIEDSIEITLFACQCCPDYGHELYCDDEMCDGEEEGRCQSELLKGCYCRPRNPPTPEFVVVGYTNVDPVLRPIQERSTTPTEPPPMSSEFWGRLDKEYGDLARHIQQKGIRCEILLRKAPEIWLGSYTLGSKLSFDTDDMLLKESLWEAGLFYPGLLRALPGSLGSLTKGLLVKGVTWG
jgi:hypothetical protein